MAKSSTAAVVDLETFRQRKQRNMSAPAASPMFVPVWVCWVPTFHVFTPFVG
jgi:hypothetical protein